MTAQNKENLLRTSGVVVTTTLSVTVDGGIVMSSVIVIVDSGAAERVTLSVVVMIDTEVIVERDVYVVARAHVDEVTVIVVPGHEEGELVLLCEIVVEVLVGVVVVPAKQVQALLNFELDAEHSDRKLGKDEAAVTKFAV